MRRLLLASPVAVVCLMTLAPSARAGANLWTQEGGPFGGRVLSLLVHPSATNKLLAGTEDGGVFVSLDGGANWEPRSFGLDLLTVNDLAAVPVGTNTVYAATTSGVYRTGNLGQSWTARSVGLGSQLATSLAIHATSSSRMLCGTANGIYATTDGGVVWTVAGNGLPGVAVEGILWDTDGFAIWACTGDGVYRAADPIVSWDPRSNGLTGLALFTRQIVRTSASASELFLATYGGVYYSPSGGGAWSARNVGLTDTRAQALWIDPNDDAHLLVATEGGVFETFDAALHWSASGTGLQSDVVIRALAHDGVDALCGSFHRGVHRRVAGQWSETNAGLSNTFVHELAVDSAGNLMAAAAYGGVFRSADAGTSYAIQASGLPVADLRTVCFHPGNPQIVYAGANYGGVYKSTDGGATFTGAGLAGETVRSIRLHPGDPQVVLVGTYDGVYRSENGGGLWSDSDAGMTSDNVNDLELDPSNPNVVYAGTYLGYVYKSTDGGHTWAQKANGLGANIVFDVAVHPTLANIVLAAGFEGDGIWRSADGGESWSDVSAGLPNRSVWEIEFDPFDPTRVYAATQGGVARSLDGGLSWSAFSQGLTVPDVRDIEVDPVDFRHVRAATWGGGVFSYTDQLTASPHLTATADVAAHLHPGYPNPFNPVTTLAFELFGNGMRRVRLELLDVRGRRVRTLVDAWLSAGPHRVRWDGRDESGAPVAGGTYYARLMVDGDAAGVQKLTLLK